MLRAVADIGSNTVKYGIYEYNGDSILPEKRAFDSKTLKLVGKIKEGIFPPESVTELAELLMEFKAKAENAGAVTFDIFATAWIRAARNSEDIRTALEKKLGTKIAVLSGDEEARFSNTALYAEAKPEGDGVCADMGGGSTEIVRFNGADVIAQKSLPMGCVVLKNKFVAGSFPTAEEAGNIADFVKNRLCELDFDVHAKTFCIVGGTAKALLTLNKKLLGKVLTPDSFGELLDFLMSASDLKKLLGSLIPDRIDTAIPGLIGFKTICAEVAPENVLIVSSGTREGFIMNKYRTKV